MYSIYLSTSDLLSFIISNSPATNLAVYGIGLAGCCNDVMHHVDCVIKRDVYPQKMHSCSTKNIRGISVFVLKISVVYIKNISLVILYGYSRS